MSRVRLGTRGSALALWQANEVSRKLREHGYEPEIHVVKTTGDRRQNVSLASIGGKGLFIKELEESLDRAEIDLAVHSLKDVPSIIPSRYVLAGFLERADPRDAWIHPGGLAIDDLPRGAVVGTSAPRRKMQLHAKYPHLQIEPIRGNVDTRIDKAKLGQFAGIVLANAGLTRLGRTAEITKLFSVDDMVPAAGQGIVALEARADDNDAHRAARAVTHQPSADAALAERGVLQHFGERLDCYSAVAVHASTEAKGFTIRAFFGEYDGPRAIRIRHSGPDPKAVITAVCDDLMANGAMDLLSAQRKD